MPNTDTVPTAEAAQIIGVSVHTIARYARRGRLVPVVKGPGIRGPMFFKRRDVERLARERAA